MKFLLDLLLLLAGAGGIFLVCYLMTGNFVIAGGGALATAISIALKRDAKRVNSQS